MYPKLFKISVLCLAIFCGWYVGTRLEFTDPYAPSTLFEGTFMTAAEVEADPLKAVSMTKEAAMLQYDTFGSFVKVLDAHGIPYWISCGTLLGAVRHEGVIPYDDDVDICIEDTYAPQVLALKGELERIGLGVYQDRTSIKVYKLNGPHVRPKKRSFKIMEGVWFVRRKIERFPTIDVYPTVVEGGKVLHSNERARAAFPREIFNDGDIFPVKDYTFGPLKVKGPQNPFTFLENAYGQSWNEKLVYQGPHSAKTLDKMEFPLTPQLRQKMMRFGVKG